MFRFFLMLSLCSSMTFAALDSAQSSKLSKRLTTAKDKISDARKNSFLNPFPADSCAACCNDGQGGNGSGGNNK